MRGGGRRLVALLIAIVSGGCARQPDVIVIVADTLRADRVGAMRAGAPLTPFLDSLAATGARFTDVRAASSWTVPSIASLFTSRFPSQHGVLGFDSVLQDDEVTLADRLQAAGYSQMGFTANFRLDALHGFAQGFDAWAPSIAEAKPRLDDVVVGALSHIDAFWTWRRTRWQRLRGLGPPRYLYLQFMEPHAPYDPPAAFVERLGVSAPPDVTVASANRRMLSGSSKDLSNEEIRYLASLYDAEVASLDAGLRHLFDELRARGLLDHTIVVVTADHGEEFREHGGMGHGTTLYDEALRVPLLITGPGVRAGTVVTDPVSLVDVAPTLLALLGLAAEPRFEGRSLAPWLGGDTEPPRDVLSELLLRGGPETLSYARTLVRGSRKLLRSRWPNDLVLYDLAADPGEQHPFTEAPPQATSMDEALAAQVAELARHGIQQPAHAPVDGDTRRRLRALGYSD